jgi:hypothetical protein
MATEFFPPRQTSLAVYIPIHLRIITSIAHHVSFFFIRETKPNPTSASNSWSTSLTLQTRAFTRASHTAEEANNQSFTSCSNQTRAFTRASHAAQGAKTVVRNVFRVPNSSATAANSPKPSSSRLSTTNRCDSRSTSFSIQTRAFT